MGDFSKMTVQMLKSLDINSQSPTVTISQTNKFLITFNYDFVNDRYRVVTLLPALHFSSFNSWNCNAIWEVIREKMDQTVRSIHGTGWMDEGADPVSGLHELILQVGEMLPVRENESRRWSSGSGCSSAVGEVLSSSSGSSTGRGCCCCCSRRFHERLLQVGSSSIGISETPASSFTWCCSMIDFFCMDQACESPWPDGWTSL